MHSLIKASIQLDFGKWHIEEAKEDTHFEYYHRPFIDLEGEIGHVRGPQP